MAPDVFDQIAGQLGSLAERNVALAQFTTYRIGGPADLLVRAHSIDDLVLVAKLVDPEEVPVLVIGQGSNLLIADQGWRGLVLVLAGSTFETIAVSNQTVRAGGAVKLPVLARTSVAAGLVGLEWMVGVPGSVGGAVRMNAGGHGSDVAANASVIRLVDLAGPGELQECAASALDFGYRHSTLSSTQVVVDVEFVCTRTTEGSNGPDSQTGDEMLREIVRWRRANQPGGANCGSVFTNPPNDSAGRLIDAAGLKGYRMGSAFVSEKHANFIQADADGRADDIWALIKHVRREVHKRFGIVLTPEVRTAGFDAALEPLS
jgi:UDP-N-acetylmuramate dehydrogenase